MSNLVFRPPPFPLVAIFETDCGATVKATVGPENYGIPSLPGTPSERILVRVSTLGQGRPVRKAQEDDLPIPRATLPLAPCLSVSAGPFADLNDARYAAGLLAPLVKHAVDAMAGALEGLESEWEKLHWTPPVKGRAQCRTP